MITTRKERSDMTEDVALRALFERLQRLETRVVRGFEELGARVTDDETWFSLHGNEVTLSGPGRSLRAIQLAIKDAGGTMGEKYEVYIGGEWVATVKGV